MNRTIINIIDGVETSDGAGVKLRRIIGGPDLNMLDPFLLFDEFGSDDPDDNWPTFNFELTMIVSYYNVENTDV